MDGREAIVNKILSDAKAVAEKTLADAQMKAQEKLDGANAWADEYILSQKPVIAKACEDIISRRKTVANLDVRKIKLAEKQAVVEETFALALKKLSALKKADYLALVNKLLEENADVQDEIILSNDGVLSASDILKLKVCSDKKLSIRETAGNFVGGVMLVGKISDKDLSFSSLLGSLKQQLTSKVALELFGEE